MFAAVRALCKITSSSTIPTSGSLGRLTQQARAGWKGSNQSHSSLHYTGHSLRSSPSHPKLPDLQQQSG